MVHARRLYAPLVAILVTAMIALPARAEAQWLSWLDQCTPGGLVCGTFQLGLFHEALGDNTTLRLRVSNLQGLTPWIPAVRSAIIHARVENLYASDWEGRAPDYGGAYSTTNTAVGEADRDDFWNDVTWYHSEGWFGVYSQQGTGGPAGCDGYTEDLRGLQNIWFPTTCGGYIETSYTLPGRWEKTETTRVRFDGLPLEGVGGVQSCTTGVDCMSVVPEPSTWVMLATGLLGLGWFSRRRRDTELLSE